METDVYKEKLEAEKTKLETELSGVGRINPDNPKDWEPKPSDLNIDPSEANDRADSVRAYEENTALVKDLEIRYNNVLRALKKIEDGTFGTCEISNEAIEEDRLSANPAARTCKAHMEEESSLAS